MIGKQAKAPCGHLGEVIVGSYVRCDICDPPSFRLRGGFRPYHEIRDAMLAQTFKAYPGHVRDCACERCRKVRAVCYFEARTTLGRTAWIAEWSGEAELNVKILPHLKHQMLAGWRALDGAGDPLYFHALTALTPAWSCEQWDGGLLDVAEALRLWLGEP